MQTAFWLAAFLGHGALWVEIVNRLHGLGWNRKLIDRLTLLCGVACAGIPIVAVTLLWRTPSSQPEPAGLATYAWLSIATLAVVILTRIGLHWDPQRDRQTTKTGIAAIDVLRTHGAAATRDATLHRLATLPGNTLLRPQLESLTIPLERLPPALAGFKIAHLTDLHMSGRVTKHYFVELVQRVNEWRPDIVCVTGDIIEHTPQIEWIDDTLGKLTPALGSYFILGNHDKKIDHDAVRQRLMQRGLVDVGDASVMVRCNDESLTLCGDERPWFNSDPILTGDEPLVLCLAHTPDRFGWAARQRIDLVLAGHNHGGQVCFPPFGPLLCPSVHGVRYAAGTFRRGRTVMHVGRGSGSLFPLRYACPPEVALITLTSLTRP